MDESVAVLTQKHLQRRRLIGRLVKFGGLVVILGGGGAHLWYTSNVQQYPEKTAQIQELLNRTRSSRLVPYDVDDTFAADDQHRLYVPNSIDRIAIKLTESSDLSGRLIQRENIVQEKVLEARIDIRSPLFGATTLTYEWGKLSVTEREIIKQIIGGAVTKAKSLGASTVVPTIDFTTQLTPDIPRGHPSYWDSKTTISGYVNYYK